MIKIQNENSYFQPLRVEVNFLKQFIFTLNEKKVGEKGRIAVITEERTSKDGKQKTKATLIIETDWEFGLGGPFDYKAFRTVEWILSKIYSVNGFISSGHIRLGSEYSILILMGIVRPSGKEYRRLKEAFIRLQRMKFFSEFATYNAEKNKWAEGFEALDPIYKKVVFTQEEMPDGSIADAVYLWLGDHYLSNLNNQYVALIDFNFYNTINNISARRLYEVINLYAHKYDIVIIKYSELCSRMRIKRWQYLSDAKRQLSQICHELMDKEYFKAVIWPEGIRLKRKDKDWIVKFAINKKLKTELTGQNKPGPTPELSENDEDKALKKIKEFFSNAYAARFNRSPFISKKDESLIIELIDNYGVKDLSRLIIQFFTSQDLYISSQSYALSFFASSSVINKLLFEIISLDEQKQTKEKKPILQAEGIETAEITNFNEIFCRT